jgi:hypothetical protein
MFSNLNFDQIRITLKDYLRSNSNFTDYDFEGSNLSVIVDLLAYNTYITSYNANMISNEVFIDSATLRENVVSLAREIGYIPRSRKSASANISFLVNTNGLSTNPLTLTLKKGIVVTSSVSVSGANYTFAIPEDITVPVINGFASFDNISVYEGTYVSQNFTVDSNNPNQRFILDNPFIDTSSIRVSVRDSVASTNKKQFYQTNNLFEITDTSKIFFIQEIEDQRYELIFGDGVFGKKLEQNNYIEVNYILTNGVDPNGAASFGYSGRIVDNNGRVVNNGISLITTNSAAQGGKEIESVDSIKSFAPRIYASQNRAVTADDYETLIPSIYTEVESVSVFGGEELSPPRYGKVYISIKPINGEFVSSAVKNNIKKTLRKYSVAGIVPEIIDLKYLYLEIDSTVYYNTNSAPSADYVRTIISNNIVNYAKSQELNQYGARFKYSKFLNLIDQSHESVTSNITKINVRRDLRVATNQFANYEICFGNALYAKCIEGYNIKTSGFNIAGINQTLYISDLPNSDGRTGSLFFFSLNSESQPVIVRKNVGSVDYIKGEFLLYPVNINTTVKTKNQNPIIEFSAVPKSNDVIGLQDLYLQIDVNHTVLNMLSDDIESGLDKSGSSYNSTSSYPNGKLVRV